MEPDGVHFTEPRSRRACGYLYATGDTVTTYFGEMAVYRCHGCGATFNSTDFADHDIIRVMDDLADINLADASED